MPINNGDTCKFCGSSELDEFQATEHMLGLGHTFTYQHCRDCGSLQLKQIPSDLSLYYPQSYYSFAPLVPSAWWKNLAKQIRMRLLLIGIPFFAPSYGYWLARLAPRWDDRIADLGCGNGQLLYELHAAGFKNLEGFDPFMKESRHIASGLKLWKRDFAESEGTYDVVMMHHAFEHMAEPASVLKNCYEKMRPGGKLLIRVPIADAEQFRREGSFWVQLDAPRHLVIPSQQGFRVLAERLGFVLEEIVFDSSAFQFLGTELYKRGFTLSESALKTNFTDHERRAFQKKALQWNLEGKGDQVCFFLRKPIKS
ncbi:class I SAM-dependent methyltransferase [Algoriphagus namhaensis]